MKSTLLVTVCIILSAILGFVAQIVYAAFFGASAQMDMYFKILSIPAIVTGISSIIFSSVLIPAFAKFKSKKLELNKFIESTWIFILIFSFMFMVIGVLFSVLNINSFIPENSSSLKYIGQQISFLVWIGSGFALMSGYLSAVLNYNEQFFKVASTSILPAFFMIMIVLLFHKELGVVTISLGFCIAFLLQFLILLKASKISLSFVSFNIKNIKYKKLLAQQSFLVSLSLLPFTTLAPISYFLASQLETGSVSYLGYSHSFSGFLSVAVSMGISIVSFPKLADKFANEEGDASLEKFEQSLKYVLLLAMFIAGVLIALRVPILSLFYQRGAFDAESVRNLASVLPWYLIAAVFTGGLNLLRILFYAKGEFKKIAKLGLIIPIIFFMLANILMEKFSFVGIGIAYALTIAILFFMTLYLARRKELRFLNFDFYIFILKNIFAVIVACFSIFLFFPMISILTSQFTTVVICLPLFLFTYLLSAKFALKFKEIDQIIEILKIKLKNIFN